jgi:Mrp family chromosome partitioning ATPase
MDFRAPMNPLSDIKKVIAVVSGKGGVGKSTVTCTLAAAMAQRGKKTAVLAADITGPSDPTAFGLHQHAVGSDLGIEPVVSRGEGGHEPLLLHWNETTRWCGGGLSSPARSSRFWREVIWGNVDFMFVDMPPGTGDVPLTVFQSLPIDGVIVVTSPQDLVSMIVTKAVKMAELMAIPILGIVENYSYFQCPDCGKEHAIFGESKVERVAADLGLKVLAKLPIDSALASACDNGGVEDYQPNPMAGVAEVLERL